MNIVDGHSFLECFKDELQGLTHLAKTASVITDENVYQRRDDNILNMLNSLMKTLVLPGTGLSGEENLVEFLDLVKSGKRGLILMEHYSNFDLPGFIYCLTHSKNPCGPEIANRLVAIAGMKLNEDNPYINACTAAFSRIVIYPSRSLAAIKDEEKLVEERERSRKINMAAMRALDKIRRKGDILLVFPSGTRYRPGKPETKRGLPEIDSYLRMFDVMLLVSINGNVLRISDNPADMSADVIYRDVLRYSVGPVLSCRNFRNEAQVGLEEKDVKKQATADKIMAELEKLHAAEAPNYEKLYSAAKNA